MRQEAKINVSPETGKRIAQVFCSEIKSSLERNGKIYKRAERNEQLYGQVTNWMKQGKVCNDPWPGAADYFVPLVEWIVDAVHARILSQIFSQEPYMQATGVESSDVPKTQGVTDFVDMAFREESMVDLYNNTNYFWKQMIKLPFAVLKYDIVKDYDYGQVIDQAAHFVNQQTGEEEYILPDDPDATMKQAQLMISGYQPAGTKDVFVREETPIHDGPKLQYIRFSDYVWAPDAKRGCRLYWEGDRDWMTVNDIRLKMQQGSFIEENAKRVIDTKSQSDKEGYEKDVEIRSSKIECFNVYGRLPFNKDNEIDFESEDVIEQEVYCKIAYQEQELLEIIHWYHRRKPVDDRVYIRGEFEETENFEGRPLVDKLYMTQKELNKLHNTMQNNAMLAMQKIFVKKRSLQGESWRKPQVYPGAIWEEDMQGDIRALSVGDVSIIGLQMEKQLIEYAERISNISVYQTGTAQKETDKTKYEVKATISEGNVGLDKFVQKCFKIMRKIAKWTVGYYAEDMPPGLERRILGETAEPLFPTDKNMPIYNQKGIDPYWREEDLTGKFDFIWNVTSLNNSKEAKIIMSNDLMERYAPHPMVAGNMLATWDLLRRGLVARGIKDWQTILPKREAIVQEMQRMQIESMNPTERPMSGEEQTPVGPQGGVINVG